MLNGSAPKHIVILLQSLRPYIFFSLPDFNVGSSILHIPGKIRRYVQHLLAGERNIFLQIAQIGSGAHSLFILLLPKTKATEA